jgi:hypothetical protein
VATKTPLDDAAKFLQPAILAGSDDSELYELAFEVYHRKNKVDRMICSILIKFNFRFYLCLSV